MGHAAQNSVATGPPARNRQARVLRLIIDDDGEQQHDAVRRRLVEGRDVGQANVAIEASHQQRADKSAENPAAAPRKQRAADDRGGDCVEFEEEACAAPMAPLTRAVSATLNPVTKRCGPEPRATEPTELCVEIDVCTGPATARAPCSPWSPRWPLRKGMARKSPASSRTIQRSIC
jgi:hypothetical protein